VKKNKEFRCEGDGRLPTNSIKKEGINCEKVIYYNRFYPGVIYGL
jgi:hypothetical protein